MRIDPTTAVAVETVILSAPPTERRSSHVLRRLLADPLGILGLVLVVLAVLSAVGADWFATHDPLKMSLRARLKPPGPEAWLGTDHLGRDVYSRILYGGRIALWVSLVAVSTASAAGLVLGMLAGYGPRWLDSALMLMFDAVRSFPTVMFALAMVTLIGPSLGTIISIVVVTSIPVYGRIVRTQTQSMKANEFILAERALGAGPFCVVFSHILPNVIGPLLILAQHGDSGGHHDRGRPELSRSRRAAAHADLGLDPARRLPVHPGHALAGDRRRHSADRHHARLHVPG